MGCTPLTNSLQFDRVHSLNYPHLVAPVGAQQLRAKVLRRRAPPIAQTHRPTETQSYTDKAQRGVARVGAVTEGSAGQIATRNFATLVANDSYCDGGVDVCRESKGSGEEGAPGGYGHRLGMLQQMRSKQVQQLEKEEDALLSHARCNSRSFCL